jgi:hypothetical protein
VSWRNLTPVLDEIAARHGYLPQGGIYEATTGGCKCYDCVRTRGESILHEVCHGVLLGIGRQTAQGSEEIAKRLNRWYDRNADFHEMKAMALEILTGRRYQARIGLRTLTLYALKGMRYYQQSDRLAIERQVKKFMVSEEVKRGLRRTTRFIESVRTDAAIG